MARKLAEIMHQARKEKGLTQQQVAQAMTISQSALSKMENGKLIPSAIEWFDFCRATGIAADSLGSGRRR
jgi:transcriptional regulator with XRE-family HTH domain